MAVSSLAWQYWASGWTSASSSIPNNEHAAIGPSDGASRYRTCLTVNLGALGTAVKRNKLEITLSLYPSASYGASKASDDTFTAMWYTGAPYMGDYNPQGTLKQTKTKYVDFGTSAFTVSFTFDISSLSKSAQTLYIYFVSQPTTTGNYHIFKFRENENTSVTEKTASDISNVTTGSITTTTGQIFLPTSSVKVSWNAGTNGTNNKVASYEVYLRYDNAPTTSTYDLRKTGLTSTSHTFSISNATRGKKVYVGVRAIGTNTSYNGSILTSKIGVINSLPAAPTVTQTGTTVDTTTSISFAITAGSDSNAGQTKTLYYSLNGNAKTLVASPLTINTSTSDVKSGSNSIVFYTYDGMEYSTGTDAYSFSASFAPSLGSCSTVHTYVKDMNNSSSSLVKNTQITYSVTGGTVSQIELYVRTASTESSLKSLGGTLVSNHTAFTTLSTSTKTFTIDITKIPESVLPKGNYFQFAIKGSDGTATSEVSSWQTVGRRAYSPKLPSYTKHTTDATDAALAKTNYYRSAVTFTGTNPTAAAGYAAISSIQIIASYGSTSFPTESSTAYGATFSQVVNLNTVPTTTPSTAFTFKVIDVLGQTTESTSAFATLIKTTELAFSTENFYVSSTTIKPYSDSSNLRITHPIASATGSGTVPYLYSIQVGSVIKSIDNYTEEAVGDDLAIIVTNEEIIGIIDELGLNTNSRHTATIAVTAVDGFNVSKKLSSTITIDFIEPPAFSSGANLIIKHDYDVKVSEATATLGTEVTSSSDLKLRMFNKGEGIVFGIPIASDPNNDIVEYQISLARNDYIDNSVLGIDNVTFSSWLTLTKEQLEKGKKDSNYYYYRYPASQYSKNEYFYFKVRAVDSQGQVSATEPKSSTYIIGCRTSQPKFSVGSVEVGRAGDTVTLSFNLSIEDLGGSAKATGWDRNYYLGLPNFERSITNYTKKMALKVEIAPDQSFSSNVSTVWPTLTTSSSFIDYTCKKATFTDFSQSHAKVFYRFTLYVSYGLDSSNTDTTFKGLAIVTSDTQTYVDVGSVPTLSHRSHRVGINTNSLSTNDVFVVENYSGSRYVKFRGTSTTNAGESYEITIDLIEGKISGTKSDGTSTTSYLLLDGAIIDGGSWT